MASFDRTRTEALLAGNVARRREIERLTASRESLRDEQLALRESNEKLRSRQQDLLSSRDDLSGVQDVLRSAGNRLRAERSHFIDGQDDLLNLFSVVRHPMFIVDGDCRIRKVSRSAAAAFGVTDVDAGRSLESLGAPFQAPAFLLFWADIVATGLAGECDVEATAGGGDRLRASPFSVDATLAGVVVELFARASTGR